MSSRARFSAVFASVRELASGFSPRIALLRFTALTFDGAAHDLTSPAVFAPLTSHLGHLILILILWLTGSEARQSFRVLNPAQASLRLVRVRSTPSTCSST